MLGSWRPGRVGMRLACDRLPSPDYCSRGQGGGSGLISLYGQRFIRSPAEISLESVSSINKQTKPELLKGSEAQTPRLFLCEAHGWGAFVKLAGNAQPKSVFACAVSRGVNLDETQL